MEVHFGIEERKVQNSEERLNGQNGRILGGLTSWKCILWDGILGTSGWMWEKREWQIDISFRKIISAI